METREKCITCGVFTDRGEGSDNVSLKELKDLCEASGAEFVGVVSQNREAFDPRTVIGKGKVEEIKNAIEALDADVVVFDCELSGSHTRNLEEELGVTVIDRSRLILDIFAQRATSKEGKCQVELAQLQYNMPRLAGIGKSLSRLGGGIGTRGPGETQLETDKRHIRERISSLKRELSEIEKNRTVQRKQRMKNDVVNIALVGYTNAGKSSLLNKLTDSSQFVKDMLFATLDPLSKKMILSDGREAVITDTVGFIRKLPHHLVEAFKSTLEEAKNADIILHIIDSSDENCEKHIETVNSILNELEIPENIPVLKVYNKIDKINSDELFIDRDSLAVSVKQNINIDALIDKITEITKTTETEKTIVVPYDKSGLVSEIYDTLKVLETEYAEEGQKLRVYGKEEIIKRYEQL